VQSCRAYSSGTLFIDATCSWTDVKGTVFDSLCFFCSELGESKLDANLLSGEALNRSVSVESESPIFNLDIPISTSVVILRGRRSYLGKYGEDGWWKVRRDGGSGG
jgi:hypothetical protein